MKVIGLTGGIGSGKSTVSTYLRDKGMRIIDADLIAREIAEPGSEYSVLPELESTFGKEIIDDKGCLDRKMLASIVFNDEKEKQKLDKIMLERILRLILQRVEECRKEGMSACVIDAPLLFEAGLDSHCNEIWVVDADEEVRIKRVMNRDSADKEEVRARIKMQMGREEKIRRATHVLDNSTTLEALHEQIGKLI